MNFDLDNPELTDREKAEAIKSLQVAKERAIKQRNYIQKVKTDPEPVTITPENIWNWLKASGIRIDSENEVVVRELVKYFSTTDDTVDKKKGVLLFGPVGVGKTLLMNRFRALTSQFSQYPTIDVVRCDTIVQAFNSPGDDGGESALIGLDKGCICFDDLGSESIGRHYGKEDNIMQRIIEMRYRTLPHHMTHFTTNLTAEQIEEFYGIRTRDRLREMTNLIAFKASSKSRR